MAKQDKLNVLIIGSGGREHALGWKLKQSPRCGQLFFLPGNAGTAGIGRNVEMDLGRVDARSADNVAFFCRDNKVGLVVIGPEDPLAGGLADKLAQWDLTVFGVSAEAAKLEADKAYAKKLMRSASIPTAEARSFTDYDAAVKYAKAHETPVVVKATGLAKGKGAIVCDDLDEALDALKRIMVDREFGEAGDTVLIEERLVGQEVSILALVNGRNIFVLEPSQDHKQVGEGDTGPNTGGMGAYTPTPLVDHALLRTIEREVLVPTVDALRRDEVRFQGVLYAGLMLTAGGPKVLEFNCRFGDPECQPLMVRMKGDLLEAVLAVANASPRAMENVDLTWDDRVACCVVVCSGGYPGPYETGLPITGIADAEAHPDVTVFHAGTKKQDGETVTAGGRVLNVCALGANLAEARDNANAAAAKIGFEGAFFRHDIGDRVLKQGGSPDHV